MGCREIFRSSGANTIIASIILFMCAGLSIFGIAMSIQLHVAPIKAVAPPGVLIGPPLVILYGVIVFLYSVVGWWVILKDNDYLGMYFGFISSIAVLMLSLAALVFIILSSVVSKVPSWTDELVKNGTILPVQETFQCCGSAGPYSFSTATLPRSCCKPNQTVCTAVTAYSGCAGILQSYMRKTGLTIGIFALVVGCIALAGAVLGVRREKHFRNRRKINTLTFRRE